MPTQTEIKQFKSVGVMMQRILKKDEKKFNQIVDLIVTNHVDMVLSLNHLTRKDLTLDQIEKAECEARGALLDAWGIDA